MPELKNNICVVFFVTALGCRGTCGGYLVTFNRFFFVGKFQSVFVSQSRSFNKNHKNKSLSCNFRVDVLCHSLDKYLGLAFNKTDSSAEPCFSCGLGSEIFLPEPSSKRRKRI